MKSILLIGLGRFGIFYVAISSCMSFRHQVAGRRLALEECVERGFPVYVTSAQIGDTQQNEEFMASLGCLISMCASWLSETIFETRWKPHRCWEVTLGARLG